MFENDYTISGKHATHMKYLDSTGIFERYIDTYMIAAIVGFLHGRTDKKDNTSQDKARIFADAFAKERANCDFIYRLIMLSDERFNISSTERIDRAFRYDAQNENEENKKNMDIFNSYVLGGVEELFEQFTEGCTSREDYIDNIYNIATQFNEEIEGISYDEKLDQLINEK